MTAGQVWFWICFVFSFASYGLSGYEWYLNAGLAVTLSLSALKIVGKEASNAQPATVTKRATLVG